MWWQHQVHPEGIVHLFGSASNHLSICNNNDLDVCLELPAGRAEEGEEKVSATDSLVCDRTCNMLVVGGPVVARLLE